MSNEDPVAQPSHSGPVSLTVVLLLICIGASAFLLWLDWDSGSPTQGLPKQLTLQLTSKGTDKNAVSAAAAPSDQIGTNDTTDESATEPATNSPTTISEEPAASGSTQNVTFRIEGLKAESSQVHVAVFDSAKGFPKPESSSSKTVVSATESYVEFQMSLPAGQKTAIAVFQDLDGDGKLTKNSIGIPVEPYGFSNAARSLFGPPSFSSAALMISKENNTVSIRVQ